MPHRLTPFLFALLASVLAALSSWGASPTNDEPTYVGQGTYLCRTADFYAPVLLWQPPLPLYVTSAALPMVDVAEGAFDAPPDLRSLTSMGDRLIFQSPSPPDHVLFAARFPVILVTGLLAALAAWLAGRVAGAVAGTSAGLIAGTLVAASPAIFSHGGLATTDIVATAAALLAVTPLVLAAAPPGDRAVGSRFAAGGGGWAVGRRAAICGAALGVALLAKHTAIALVPVTWLGVFLLARRDPSAVPTVTAATTWRRPFLLACAALVAAGVVVWAGYGFHTGPLVPPGSRHDLESRIGPQADWLTRLKADLPVAAPRYWSSLAFQAAKQHGRLYFRYFDETSKVGWWTYFPVVTLGKLTLGSIMLLGTALWTLRSAPTSPDGQDGARRPRTASWERILLLAFALPFGAAILSRHNLGVRHVLPAIAPLLVWAAARIGLWIEALPARTARRAAWVGAMAILHLAEGTGAVPDGVAWWNLAAGGTRDGWRVAADSNADWGQGLWRLRDEMKARGIGEMWIAAGSPGPASSIAAAEKDGIRVCSDSSRTAPLPATGWIAVSTGLWRAPGHAALTDEPPEFTVAGCYRVYRLPLRSRTP